MVSPDIARAQAILGILASERPWMSIYGLSAGILKSLPMMEALDAIAKAGFSAVELRACQGTVGSWGAGPALMRQALA